MNSLEIINKIDNAITGQLSTLGSLVESLEWSLMNPFLLNENTSQICDEKFNYAGLYLFEIKDDTGFADVTRWMDDFSILWIENKMAWVPGIKLVRTNWHRNAGQIGEWVPLYIGKSRFIGRRINEHILKDVSKSTFAMKLKARTNLYGKEFRVKTLKLDVYNYDVIAPYLERQFRQQWHPIVGRQ